MAVAQSHTDIFETDVSGKTKNVYLGVTWDNHQKEYVISLRTSLCRFSIGHETIYFYRVTAYELQQRLPYALELVRGLDMQSMSPLRGYIQARGLLQTQLQPRQSVLWAPCDFEDDNLTTFRGPHQRSHNRYTMTHDWQILDQVPIAVKIDAEPENK